MGDIRGYNIYILCIQIVITTVCKYYRVQIVQYEIQYEYSTIQ